MRPTPCSRCGGDEAENQSRLNLCACLRQTTIKLAKAFVDKVYDTVKKWDGFETRAGKYGLRPFTKHLYGLSTNYEKTLVADVTRMCKVFGLVIDRVLQE